jgi:arylformamidase
MPLVDRHDVPYREDRDGGEHGHYVDAPFHRYAGGADLADLPLDRIADLDALVVSVDPEQREIGPRAFPAVDLRGRALLIHTGWSRHFGTPAYFEGHPYLTRAGAQSLVEAGVAFVGIDSLNIDDTADGARPAHSLLLGAGIPIGEHFTNLAALPATGARLHAVPVKVRSMGTFPVRAYAVV